MASSDEKAKITLLEGITMFMLVGSADTADFVAGLAVAIPVVGPAFPIISWFYGFGISSVMVFWFTMKGTNTGWILGGSGIDFIPIVNMLPGRTAALIATIAEQNLPPALESIAKTASGKLPVK